MYRGSGYEKVSVVFVCVRKTHRSRPRAESSDAARYTPIAVALGAPCHRLMWRKKRKQCLERRRRLRVKEGAEPEEQEGGSPFEETATPGRSMNVQPLHPGEISALRHMYLRKRFTPPKYNFAEALRQRTRSASLDAKGNCVVPKFAATHGGKLESLVIDIDDFDGDVMMWEPPTNWAKWASVPIFNPIVMPKRPPETAYAAIVDSTIRQWRLDSFSDQERLRKIKQHSQDQETMIRKELAEETLRREEIKRSSESRGKKKSLKTRKGKRSKKSKSLKNISVIRALDRRLSELDQSSYLMSGYERERAGLRRRPHSAMMMKRIERKTTGKKKKKKKKAAKKKVGRGDNPLTTLDPRSSRRKRRRQSIASRKLRQLRTLAITAEDLAVSNKLREVFLESARISINADRAAFWVFDEAAFELWTYSEKGTDEILRVQADMGIVGQCFMQGSAVIVHDAYMLKNFSAKMDRRTGYVTKSVLCLPCHAQDQVPSAKSHTNLGCIQLLNKRSADSKFNTRDATLVQLQLTILRAYIRQFRTKDGLDENLKQLAKALRGVRQVTKNVDEELLKLRFVGIAKEFGTFKFVEEEQQSAKEEDAVVASSRVDVDAKVKGTDTSTTAADLSSDEVSSEEEEYVTGVRNDFSSHSVRVQPLDRVQVTANQGPFTSESFLSSDVKGSDLERQAASQTKFDRNPWRTT